MKDQTLGKPTRTLLAGLLASLGPEPFDPALTPTSFHTALHARRSPIKTVLLSGEVVVGAGNIYAAESLYRAGIHPLEEADAYATLRDVHHLPPEEIEERRAALADLADEPAVLLAAAAARPTPAAASTAPTDRAAPCRQSRCTDRPAGR